jgi:hypothetical protein
MLMDGDGSNSSRHYIFKQDLQALVDELGIDIRVAHYPPYTSKWNPIEHRVFLHITRTLQGMVLTSHQITKELIERATTKTGLTVVACILNKVFGSLLNTSRQGIEIQGLVDCRQLRFRARGFADMQGTPLGALK